MVQRIAINGFGRIGKAFLRALLADEVARESMQVVAINLGPIASDNVDTLFKYDSVMGTFDGEVTQENNTLFIDDHEITLLHEAAPEALPWKKLGISWVVEASGKFIARKDAAFHLSAGAQKVLVTAPSADADVTIVPGINDECYDAETHTVISLGSCTTNCFAPLVKVMHEEFGIVSGVMTTVHAYTNNQAVLDSAHKDPRRGRAAACNIIPAQTGANKVITQLFPELEGKLSALALRVPVPNVSLVDFSFVGEKPLSAQKINNALLHAAGSELQGILGYSDLPLVSSDFQGSPFSSIVDVSLTQCSGQQGKVFSWYDNEFGYSCRLKDFLLHNC